MKRTAQADHATPGATGLSDHGGFLPQSHDPHWPLIIFLRTRRQNPTHGRSRAHRRPQRQRQLHRTHSTRTHTTHTQVNTPLTHTRRYNTTSNPHGKHTRTHTHVHTRHVATRPSSHTHTHQHTSQPREHATGPTTGTTAHATTIIPSSRRSAQSPRHRIRRAAPSDSNITTSRAEHYVIQSRRGSAVVPAGARTARGGHTGRTGGSAGTSKGDREETTQGGRAALHKRPLVTASSETRHQAMHCDLPSCRHQTKCQHPPDEAVRGLIRTLLAAYLGTSNLPHNWLMSTNEARVSLTCRVVRCHDTRELKRE